MLRVFGPVLDPLTALAFVAGATERIRLGTDVLILPYRDPVVLANGAASLDALSGGRFSLGVGVGWSEEEFAAVGVPRRERGARTDEMLEAMKALWTGRPATFGGRFYSFEGATLGTTPRTEGGPPILVGGYSDAALGRALRIGSGWSGFGDSPGRIREVRGRLDRLGEETGRDPGELEIVTTLRVTAPDGREAQERAGGAAGEIGRLEDAGLGLCVLAVSPSTPETFRWAAQELGPRLFGG